MLSSLAFDYKKKLFKREKSKNKDEKGKNWN